MSKAVSGERALVGLLASMALWIGSGALPAAGQETAPGIEFRASGEPGLDTIFLVGVGSEDPGGILKVEVHANEVTDLYGVSLAIQLPKKLLKFPQSRETAFVEGSFLSEAGAEETILLVRQRDDDVIVGLSRKGETGGVSGSGLLLSLELRGLGVPGKRALRLRRVAAFDPQGAEIENMTWRAGKVVVTTAG